MHQKPFAPKLRDGRCRALELSPRVRYPLTDMPLAYSPNRLAGSVTVPGVSFRHPGRGPHPRVQRDLVLTAAFGRRQ